MNKIFIKLALALIGLAPTMIFAQSRDANVKEWFGATPDLHVSGKNLVDPEGNVVTLHGVMDTPNLYFNNYKWSGGYETDQDVANCLAYFSKVMDAVHNPEKGTYCNLFRLHLDPAWTTDNNIIATGFKKEPDLDDNGVQKKTSWGSLIWKYTDPTGQIVESEANICHFSMTRFKTYLEKLYIPIVKKALAHGMYVIMRPPGVFPHTVTVSDYYNQYLLNIWDVVSSDPYIKAHAGQISFELGNEPVAVNGYLADFFQPIINKIRSNGFTGVVWAPGATWQQNYTSYTDKRLNDNNLGFAVHFYPGWFKTIANDSGSPQSNTTVLNDFKSMVPVQATNPIVITEVDWSPEKSGAGHVNESGQQVEGNFGTWGTGSTSEKGKFGEQFKYVVDQCGNISWNLQGTLTYVDMEAYLRDGTIQPAFTDQMKAMGYTDASQACSGTCFRWFYDYACGNQLPHGEVHYETEFPTGTAAGNAVLKGGHYEFYTPNNSAFVFSDWAGIELSKCADFIIELGDNTIGYRLDVQILGNDGTTQLITTENSNGYFIGNETDGTRITDTEKAKKQIFNFQELYADYIENYPGCKIGNIRLNTVVDYDKEDTDKTGQYYFTLDKMELNQSELVAREGNKGTSLADIKMYRHTAETNYVYNNPKGLGGWGNGKVTDNNDGSYKIVISEKKNPWEGQFNLPSNYVNGTEYTLQLEIKGSVAGSIGAAIQKSEGYEGRGNFPSIPVTTSWQTVTVKATVTGEGADRILLNYGDYLGTLEIRNIKVFTEGQDKATEITGKNIEFGKKTGAEFFGAGLLGNVAWNEYADLSQYKTMVIKGTGGMLRVLYNRPETGTCPELNLSFTNGEAVVDLSAYPYFHLNSIKAGNGQTVNVESIMLTGGNNVEVADYYITGAGHVDASTTAALADEHATVIDITGYTGKFAYDFKSANPNCLLVYQGDGDLIGGAFDAENVVKKEGEYSAWRIDLVDGYDFRAPFGINTVGGASYTRNLSTKWATIALPFTLDVTATTPLIYQLTSVTGDEMVFTKAESGTIEAGKIILYYNENSGKTTLNAVQQDGIAKTEEGFNIQPIADVNGWYTAQSFTKKVIDDVTKDPVLKDYEVYGISGDKFVHATKKLTLNPFRGFYLCKKSSNSVKASMAIRISEDDMEDSIDGDNEKNAQTIVARYDASGRRISKTVKGVNILRMSDGTSRCIIVK